MTTDNFCFHLQNRLIQTSQTGGQWYSDTSPFSIPWLKLRLLAGASLLHSGTNYDCKETYSFVQFGLNEADTSKSSSILIYYNRRRRIYT